MKNFFNIIAILFACFSIQAAEPAFSTSTNRASSRIVIVENRRATEHFIPVAKELPQMIQRGLLRLLGKTDSRAAWKELITKDDIVGIKVVSAPGRTVGTRPEVVDALVANMVNAGIKPDHIVIWDKRLPDLYLAGFGEIASRYHVRLNASASAGWSTNAFYENAILGTPVWGDLEFEKSGPNIGRKSYVSQLLTKEITKIISVSPLLNHNTAGVAGNLCSLSLGSVDNSVRFDTSPDRMATAVPEIYALPQISDKVILCITDALVCQYQGQSDTLLHYSVPLNQIWFSTDPVALDALAIDELDRQREHFGAPKQKLEPDLYKNATLLELGTSEISKITVDRIQ